MQFDLQALEFRPWGFRHLRIDQAALCRPATWWSLRPAGIFPDGLLFEIPESDPAPPAKPLGRSLRCRVESVDVYLAVPSYRERGFNVASARRDAETRYRAEVEMIRDENTGQSEKPVTGGPQELRLGVGRGESGGQFHHARGEGPQERRRTVPGWTRPFVPPLLDFEASDYLVSIARRLVEILSAKSSELAGPAARKTKAWRTSPPPTSRVSGFFTRSTQPCRFSGIF